jgi:hypothetical protein
MTMKTISLLCFGLVSGLALVSAAQDVAKSAEAAPAERAYEPNTLNVCPVSGEELGSMGEPITVTVEGRDVRLCCKGCVRKIEAEPAKYLKVVDEGLAAQQKPYYPLTKCLVSGEPLVEDGKDVGVDVMLKNRLFRICCENCIKGLKKDIDAHFATLDAAVKEAQAAEYPLTTCAVREKSKLGAMGEPAELVVGNRLVRFCCEACLPKFDKDPLGSIARLDAAWAPIHAKRSASKEHAGGAKGHGEHGDGGR